MNHCVVVGCNNYVGKKPGLRFFRFPSYQIVEKRARWIVAVRREKWTPGNGARICNEHFVLGALRMLIINQHYFKSFCVSRVHVGEPHRAPDHVDFVPSVFPTAHKRTGKSG